MKLFKTLIAVAMMATSLCASAQEKEYEFVPHWYVELGGGVQHTLGEASFSDLLSPNAQLGIGYNFNPILGVRVSADAWQSKGGWSNPEYTFAWKYVAPKVDLTVNLSNAICGFNPKRVMNVSIFGGVGANIAWGNDEAQNIPAHNGYKVEYLWDGTKIRPVGNFGLDVDFRLSDRVSLGLEAAANVLSDKYNSKKAGNADWYFNGLANLKIALGKTYKTIEAPVEPAPVVPAKPVEKVVEKPAPVVQAPAEKTINVFFLIRSHEISAEENAKIQDMVNFLKANPSKKVTVTGYADAGTGNPTINEGYAKNRAEAVTKALVDAGIDASRIITDSKGDTVQPFEGEKNRVVIAIAK